MPICKLSIKQSFSTLALSTFWMYNSLQGVWEAVLCSVGWLAKSLASIHQMLVAPL
jgi:hypothetical protein